MMFDIPLKNTITAAPIKTKEHVKQQWSNKQIARKLVHWSRIKMTLDDDVYVFCELRGGHKMACCFLPEREKTARCEMPKVGLSQCDYWSLQTGANFSNESKQWTISRQYNDLKKINKSKKQLKLTCCAQRFAPSKNHGPPGIIFLSHTKKIVTIFSLVCLLFDFFL